MTVQSMIDITSANIIPLCEVPNHLPTRPNGKKIHISAVYRWISRGVRGICLEVIRIGGRTYTSTEALQQFADRQTKSGQQTSENQNTTKSRQKQIDQAARQAKKLMESNS